MICWAINDYTKIKNVGLCPNQRNLAEDLARNAGVPFNEVSYWLAGINHFAFYLELTWRGQDLYPKFREKYKEKVYSGIDAGWRYENPPGNRVGIDLVEVEMFKKFGYFTTGSSGHISKYVPYFMRTEKQKETYKLGGETGSVSGLAFDNSKRKAEEEELKRQIAGDYKFPLTDEYRWTIFAVNIIDSIATGTVRRLNCNVKNDGLITNVTQGCCVEVPCMVDKEGIHPCHIGDLPAQCAALIQPNIYVQELAVRGSVEKDKNKLFQSILLDPLTASICTIDEMQQMFEEMCAEEKEYLKGFK
jgi:alpha-galactosidase